MYQDDVYVVVPVYNKAEAVRDVVESLNQQFANIICVDDGSTDDSLERLIDLPVTIVRHVENKGQGAALRTGIKTALQDPRARCFITFDADGQHRVEDALALAHEIKQTKHDIVLGSRFLGSAENIGFIRLNLLKLAVWFSKKTTGLDVTDTHNGLRIFNRAFAQEVAKLRCHRMAHASEILYRVAQGKYRYSEIPVTVLYTPYSKRNGQSMWNAWSVIREFAKFRSQIE